MGSLRGIVIFEADDVAAAASAPGEEGLAEVVEGGAAEAERSKALQELEQINFFPPPPFLFNFSR